MSLAYAQPSAEEILRRADEVRFPQAGFEVDVRVRRFEHGRATNEYAYKILSKGNENGLVITFEPASRRGRMLLIKGRDVSLYVPRVSQPLRLSPMQWLFGQVTSADLARPNLSGDYSPRYVMAETIGKEIFHVLDLTAVERQVAYSRIRYWVRHGDYRPHKAEFYSITGRLLKTRRYEDFRDLGGEVRPTRLVEEDALQQANEAIFEYSNLKLRELPDQIFTKEYLRRLD